MPVTADSGVTLSAVVLSVCQKACLIPKDSAEG
jgi:hypothetical protein